MASDRKPTEHSHREGPEAVHRFEGTMERLLRISKEELAKREAAYKKSRQPQVPKR